MVTHVVLDLTRLMDPLVHVSQLKRMQSVIMLWPTGREQTIRVVKLVPDEEINKLSGIQPALPQRPWLKSHEVRRLLKISHGTLQHLRDSGQLKFSKVGGDYVL